jgi:hypothetical protein
MSEHARSVGLLPPTLVGYEVFRVPAARALKTYRCPACANDIGPGDGHVVAWPAERSEDRRHWHHHCWRIAARRGRVDH